MSVGSRQRAIIGGEILALAGNEPDDETVEDDALVRAWVLHQLIASTSTVAAVLDPAGD